MVPKLPMAMLAWVSLTLSGSAMISPLEVSGTPFGFFPAFAASFLLILGSEIGDKTFFIAAILSMKNSHVVVFAGAISALVVMTILSTGLGVLLPTVLSKEITHFACILLFAFFGFRLLYDVYTSDAKEGENDELREVEMELAQTEQHVESGDTQPDVSPSRTPDDMLTAITLMKDRVNRWWSANQARRVFFQAFVMTFLAEWGDRSQIATIALASSKDPFGVTLGGIVGHSLCTGGAVLGGKYLASRISERHVNIAGGCLFLFFALASIIMGVDE